MEFVKSTSTIKDNYEILIRKRGDNDYASYCPQLNFMIKGFDHSQVKEYMSDFIDRHIASLTDGVSAADSEPIADDTMAISDSHLAETDSNPSVFGADLSPTDTN